MHKKIYQENMLRGLLNHSLDAFIVVNKQMEVLEWNQNATKLFGWTEDEARGEKINKLLVPRDFMKYHAKTHHAPAAVYNDRDAHPILNRRLEVPARRKDGSEFPIELTVIPVESDGELFFCASIRDLTQRRTDEAELARRANLINLSRDGIYVVDENHVLTLWNQGAEKLYGYTSQEALGRVSYELLKTDFSAAFKGDTSAQEGFIQIIKELMINKTWEGELTQYTKTGEKVVVLSRWTVDDDENEVLVTNTDITQIKKHADRVEFLATHDDLTGLPNRRLLDDRLHQAIALSHRNGTVAGVMLLDLDRFKYINDSLGHDFGDRLLVEISRRLINVVRENDTVARLGGDEFVIIVEDVEDSKAVGAIAQKIIDVVCKPVILSGKEVTVGTSIGITVYPQDGSTIEHLMRQADMAMYSAKGIEKGSYRFFNNKMNEEIQKRLADENDLRRAVENNEFILHYMPKVCTFDRKTTGVEALIRWKHPTRGIVSPIDFIGLAEEIGLIGKIGEWVLMTACKQAKKWQDEGHLPIQMSVNLSLHQLVPGIVQLIERALNHSGLDPQWLDIEITESAAMKNVEDSIKTLTEIRALGVSLSIDDFGTGYSSLAYLKRMPLNCLKIDQSFIRGIPDDGNDICLVKTIIRLAHNLGLKVVAEGVYDSEQVAFLDTMKCDEMQGYLFSRPEEPDVVGDDLIEHQWRYPYHIRLVPNTGSSICNKDLIDKKPGKSA